MQTATDPEERKTGYINGKIVVKRSNILCRYSEKN
jgi:hypothetical protein